MRYDKLNKIKTRRLPGLAGFTLIELLIVIGLLGALATLILPQLHLKRTEVLDTQLAPAEMMDICRAFAAFEADYAPTSADRNRIRDYGLEILMDHNPARGWDSSLGTFDPDRGKGWRGPYIEQQGQRTVFFDVDADPNNSGQPQTGGSGSTVTIPVVRDPYSDSQNDDHYYRVIHKVESGKDHLKLVFIGSDGELGTADDVERVLLTW